MKTIHLVCMDKKGGIGKDGVMPWRLPDESKWFADVTKNKMMVMGGVTARSLPDKFEIGTRSLAVLSNNMYLSDLAPKLKWSEHLCICDDKTEVLELAAHKCVGEIYICGGAKTYSMFPPDQIIATVIDDVYDCDAFYPFKDEVYRGISSGQSRFLGENEKEGWQIHRLSTSNHVRGLSMSNKHNHYYKDVRHLDEIDVYQVCNLFNVNDPSGCLQHAIKKILLPGERGGGKSAEKDLSEAIDSLQRKLDILKSEGPSDSVED